MKKKKILVADPDENIIKLLKKHKSYSQYEFETAKDGFECLSKLDKFHPDLVLIELMLPKIHGIEILRRIKADPRLHETGVIVTTVHMMIQNYKAATRFDCDFFLGKPFLAARAFSLFKTFFASKLYPEPFAGLHSSITEGKHCYVPKIHTPHSYIKFWGTRGSNPVSGPDYVRFGGNTVSLEVRHGKDIIIVVIISHTHWDHLAGFPFFAPIYDPHCKINIYSPIGYEKSTRELFTEMLAYAYFPVRLDDIQANLVFHDIQESVPFHIGDIEVNSHYSYHPGATVCFKFRVDKKTFGYATDNEFLMGYHGNPSLITKKHPLLHPYQSQINFFKDCDFLVHEAQYTPIEYQKKVGWGHSSITNATALIRHTGIHDWIITHHDPKHTDIELLKKMQMQFDIFDDAKLDCHPRMAFDGLVIPL
ncbi:MAG: response regulator [Candidatus Melainabacteria bacterium]|nr:response regulator [Candidatus Melainabacteria bacterium]